MTLQLEDTGPTVPAEIIDEFERRVGATLPQEYRQFLLTVNGGWATTDFHHPASADGDHGVRCLYGIGVEDEYRSMERSLGAYEGRYPAEFLPFGEDPGGNLVLIQWRGSDVGSVHFWDHEEEADEDEPPTYRNITRISDSFSAYLEELEPYELPEEDLAMIAEYRRKHGLDT